MNTKIKSYRERFRRVQEEQAELTEYILRYGIELFKIRIGMGFSFDEPLPQGLIDEAKRRAEEEF